MSLSTFPLLPYFSFSLSLLHTTCIHTSQLRLPVSVCDVFTFVHLNSQGNWGTVVHIWAFLVAQMVKKIHLQCRRPIVTFDYFVKIKTTSQKVWINKLPIKTLFFCKAQFPLNSKGRRKKLLASPCDETGITVGTCCIYLM